MCYNTLITIREIKHMNIAFISILVMAIMPIVCAGLAKFSKSAKPYDNNNPRDFMANLTGWQKRANAAQANCFEALPLYAAAVLVAAYNHANIACITSICISVIILRIVYIYLYIADKANLRSLVWFIAFLLTASMFFIN
jgi:uncharacterized MAPEG superfamily protein